MPSVTFYYADGSSITHEASKDGIIGEAEGRAPVEPVGDDYVSAVAMRVDGLEDEVDSARHLWDSAMSAVLSRLDALEMELRARRAAQSDTGAAGQ